MDITNLEEVRELLDNVYDLFMDIDDKRKRLEEYVKVKDEETIDYLHELELAKLRTNERNKVINSIIEIRHQRRTAKDQLKVIGTLKGYTKKYIEKGIIADTKQVITNLSTLEKELENRIYKPRVVKDLKCAKKE